MAQYISRTSYDHIPAHIVSVIASFDSKGHIKPLYVRIGDEPLKVHSSWIRPTRPGMVVFHCNVEDGNQMKPLILTYHPKENVWTIPA